MIFLFFLSKGEEENEIISLYLHSRYSKWWPWAGTRSFGEIFPLLKKYAFFLQSEDALPDFQCFLLSFAKNLQLNELIISTDGAIISYINKAIYHHYIALSKAKRHQLPTVSIESQTDYDPLQFDTAFSESDTYNNLLLLDLKRALSTEEYHIIYDHYFRQYSIQEIAARDNKSRQAINKCKKTAIAKLKRYFGVTS